MNASVCIGAHEHPLWCAAALACAYHRRCRGVLLHLIGYANDCHIDVVPHLILADGQQVVINYADNAFEDTNPQGFTDWMKEKDDLAGGNLRRVIRLMKYLRDFKNTFSCPVDHPHHPALSTRSGLRQGDPVRRRPHHPLLAAQRTGRLAGAVPDNADH